MTQIITEPTKTQIRKRALWLARQAVINALRDEGIKLCCIESKQLDTLSKDFLKECPEYYDIARADLMTSVTIKGA